MQENSYMEVLYKGHSGWGEVSTGSNLQLNSNLKVSCAKGYVP